MKALIDMNLSPRLAETLSDAGIESVHWSHIGPPDAKDSELFSYAKTNGHILVTCDLDFSAILSHTSDRKPSVVQLRLQAVDADIDAVAIAAALKQNESALETGAILTIDPRKYRIRLLPLITTA
jgi:predicted nuclease of predicted toxin-antitoxin system